MQRLGIGRSSATRRMAVWIFCWRKRRANSRRETRSRWMKSSGTTRLWKTYRELPASVRELARKNYRLWISDPRHPTLHFMRIGVLWSIRVGIGDRALAVETADGFCWVWIGSHVDYGDLMRSQC